jgi:hypothetical protein
MGIKALLEDNIIKEVPLYEVMGFTEPNDTSSEIGIRILVLIQHGRCAIEHKPFVVKEFMKIAKRIRKERSIHVCSVCRRFKSGDGWVQGILKADGTIIYPQGKQTHTFCPECYNEYYKDEIEAGILKEMKECREASLQNWIEMGNSPRLWRE